MTPEDLAVEEWKQLQAIVGRLETLVFQNRGWLLLLLGALVAALYSEKLLLWQTHGRAGGHVDRGVTGPAGFTSRLG